MSYYGPPQRSSGGCAGGCFGTVALMFLVIVAGFWPIIFFEGLPTFFKTTLWLYWAAFLISGVWILARKWRRSKVGLPSPPLLSPEEEFIMQLEYQLESGEITYEEYEYALKHSYWR